MSLRTTHLLFILIVIVAADMFGMWAVRHNALTGDGLTLALGVLSFLIGFALVGYVIWFVHKLDKARIE